MDKCFVMQPFDDGPFDKRFDDVFSPAISAAGLEAYRVDRDPGVSIPIEDIENGIRHARICLADITIDNPNVWFELGLAIAVPKEVVLVCSGERSTKFPFDIQHRNIVKYKTEAPRDFDDLKTRITARLKALMAKESEIGKFSSMSPLKEMEGLAQHEIVCLVTVMQNCLVPGKSVVPRQIKDDMTKAGFTDVATSLALRALLSKGMVEQTEENDFNGETYTVVKPTEDGIAWLMQNQDKILLSKAGADIPF